MLYLIHTAIVYITLLLEKIASHGKPVKTQAAKKKGIYTISGFTAYVNTPDILCASMNTITRKKYNIIDILRTTPSPLSFSERVAALNLSSSLQKKIINKINNNTPSPSLNFSQLSQNNEQELATEVLLRRHAFTCKVFENKCFRQAAITIIQNIYLFQKRRIFFGADRSTTAEQQRQEALLFFTSSPKQTSVPLAKTFQHLILARVWDRIITTSSDSFLSSPAFRQLHDIVDELNTLRNIYMLFSVNLVRKLTEKTSKVYMQSITHEDAVQIGSFGVARAAYRYSPDYGIRFSTYAARWVQKEIQRQALAGRLIRLPASVIEKYAQICLPKDNTYEEKTKDPLQAATTKLLPVISRNEIDDVIHDDQSLQEYLEKKELHNTLLAAIQKLPERYQDLIFRRYGIGPFQGKKQSVIEISHHYGVTRSSVYQQEQTSLKKLRDQLTPMYP